MFQFPEFASYAYVFSARYPIFNGVGFPIRRSSDYSLCNSSPKLFAVTYVLHRLQVPRHPPYTLSSFPKDTHSPDQRADGECVINFELLVFLLLLI